MKNLDAIVVDESGDYKSLRNIIRRYQPEYTLWGGVKSIDNLYSNDDKKLYEIAKKYGKISNMDFFLKGPYTGQTNSISNTDNKEGHPLEAQKNLDYLSGLDDFIYMINQKRKECIAMEINEKVKLSQGHCPVVAIMKGNLIDDITKILGNHGISYRVYSPKTDK